MIHLKQFENTEPIYKDYVMIDFGEDSDGERYYILKTSYNQNPSHIYYYKYFYFEKDQNKIIGYDDVNGNLNTNNFKITFQTDSEDEALDKLLMINQASKYNL